MTLRLADHCCTYLFLLSHNQAEKDMEAVLSSDSFDMAEAIEVFDRFFYRAETRIICGMQPEWLPRFNQIGHAHSLRERETNPVYCRWTDAPADWFAEGCDVSIR